MRTICFSSSGGGGGGWVDPLDADPLLPYANPPSPQMQIPLDADPLAPDEDPSHWAQTPLVMGHVMHVGKPPPPPRRVKTFPCPKHRLRAVKISKWLLAAMLSRSDAVVSCLQNLTVILLVCWHLNYFSTVRLCMSWDMRLDSFMNSLGPIGTTTLPSKLKTSGLY